MTTIRAGGEKGKRFAVSALVLLSFAAAGCDKFKSKQLIREGNAYFKEQLYEDALEPGIKLRVAGSGYDTGWETLDAPCTERYVWQFEFVSLPFMALSAFVFIATLMVAAKPADPDPIGTPDE